MPLGPRRPISSQRVPASWRSGNPQQRQPRLIAELRPGHDSPIWTLKAQVTDALQDRFGHNRESLQSSGPKTSQETTPPGGWLSAIPCREPRTGPQSTVPSRLPPRPDGGLGTRPCDARPRPAATSMSPPPCGPPVASHRHGAQRRACGTGLKDRDRAGAPPLRGRPVRRVVEDDADWCLRPSTSGHTGIRDAHLARAVPAPKRHAPASRTPRRTDPDVLRSSSGWPRKPHCRS